jgi:hypothetical protein
MEAQPTASSFQSPHAMTTKDWLITIIISYIPIVGIIMLFIWAFGSDTPETKANWAKAMLLFYVLMIVLSIVLSIVFGAALFTSMQNFQ